MSLLRRKKGKVRVELYTKRECHLCDQAKAILLKFQRNYPIELVETDITLSSDLYDRYKEQIPVVLVEGRKAFKFRIDEAKLRSKIEALL